MSEPNDDPRPSGILVIDGDRMSFARTPHELEPVAQESLAAGAVVPEILVIGAMAEPRRQRVGPQAIAVQALRDYPFYAFADACGPDALAAIATARTPLDRMMRRAPDRGEPDTLAVADGEVATLLAAVFADLAARDEDGAARLHAKWAFGDNKRALSARLSRLATRSARANRPLRLLNYRCGDAAWSLAVDPSIDYVGVDDRDAWREAAAARWPGRAIHAPQELSRATVGEVGVFLLTDIFEGLDLEAALRPLAPLAARDAVVIGLLPHGPAGGGSHGIIDEPRVNRLSVALGRAFGGTCELRRLETIAHKPFDALPGTTLVEFEVER